MDIPYGSSTSLDLEKNEVVQYLALHMSRSFAAATTRWKVQLHLLECKLEQAMKMPYWKEDAGDIRQGLLIGIAHCWALILLLYRARGTGGFIEILGFGGDAVDVANQNVNTRLWSFLES